ncbi:putative ATP-grasp superfamily ATP-dependent carboligase [Halomonas fontilapidosi]|uniref:Putative ATP-grasp superfamily ATP-dependent carboligase n=1 Tax=Halomonas fontilapidosi TaxID=616675 RepID=A0A7W5DJS7_9GAMM|nr:monooxygenase [Halomonas fontilapidosi]MBB3184242.1 putative ATP-grasp superfamily ATP-dependent carboligase [Halomonas fontilapidosi]
MAVILQVHFPFPGPFGDEMADALAPLAKSINEEPGLVWKIWTEDAERQLAGGVYLFATRQDAEAYRHMHTARLEGMGISGIEAQILETNEALTAINGGPLAPAEG